MGMLQFVSDLWNGKKPSLQEKANTVVSLEAEQRKSTVPTDTTMLWWCHMPSGGTYDTVKMCLAMSNGSGGSECFISAKAYNHGWVHFPTGFEVNSQTPVYKALDAARLRIQWGLAQNSFIPMTDPVRAEQEFIRQSSVSVPPAGGFTRPGPTG